MAFSSFGSFHSHTSKNKIKAASSSGSNFSKTSIAGLQVWYDGADPYGNGTVPTNATGISTWTDKAGNGYNATSYGTAGAYNLASKSITFTGSTYYTTNYPANPTNESVFVVFSQSSNATSSTMVGSNPGGRALATYNPSTSFGVINASVAWGTTITNALPTQGAIYLGEGFFSGTSTYASVNGNLTISGPTTVPAYNSGTLTQLGFQNTTAAPNSQFYGNIMEILIYNSNMQASATNRQKVEGYLAWKWGIQTSLPSSHPYYSAAPVFTLAAPSAPTSVSASALSSTSVSVTFTPPSGTVTSYTVTSSPGSISASGSSSPITVTGLTAGTAYTFTVTATNAGGTSSASTASSSIICGLFTNTSISGLQLWVDASDNTTVTQSSNLISSWRDKSTNNYSMIQAESAKPTYSANSLNSRPGVQFSNSTYLYQLSTNLPNFTTSSSLSLYAVIKTPTAASLNGWYLISSNWLNNNFSNVGNGTTRYIWALYNGTTPGVTLYVNNTFIVTGSTLALNGTNAIVGFTISSTGATMSVNGTISTAAGKSLVSSTAATDTVYISDTRSDFVSNMVVYEMLGFNTQLSSTDYKKLEGYLAWKWGIQTSLPSSHPYYSAAPTF